MITLQKNISQLALRTKAALLRVKLASVRQSRRVGLGDVTHFISLENSSPFPGREFRGDINTLRAIAVTCVVLYHFGCPGFQGGFLGVDVFFVISGYLMTSIVIGRITTQRFSLLTFYAERARRIVPALLLLIVVILAFGWHQLLPSEYLRLGKEALASSLFLSNELFRRGSGYFEDGSAMNWLLHTWSLSVEWQFYLLYPILLWASSRFSVRHGPISIVALFLLSSFLFSLGASHTDPLAAFFLLPSRAWELLAGGLVFMLPSPRWSSKLRETAVVIGLASIGAGLAYITPSTIWPGWAALLPVIGTSLVIAADNRRFPIYNIKIFSGLGKISYSVYLWHWPILVAIHRSHTSLSWQLTAGGVAASVIFGYVSFLTIEGVARKSQKNSLPSVTRPRWITFSIMITSVALVSCAAYAIWNSGGFPERFEQQVQIADAEAGDVNHEAMHCLSTSGPPAEECILGNGQRAPILTLLGDSHALSVASALKQALPTAAGASFRFAAYASCPTIEDVAYPDSDNHCLQFNQKHLLPLFSDTDHSPVLIVNYWSSYIRSRRLSLGDAKGKRWVPFNLSEYQQHFLDTMCKLSRVRSVYLTLPLPEFSQNVPATVARNLLSARSPSDVSVSVAQYTADNQIVLALMNRAHSQCGVTLMDPIPYLCHEGSCAGSINGRPLYLDKHHLSEYGNRQLIPMFRDLLQTLPS